MRASRLIYIENDPALRNILGKMLASSPELELLQDFGRAEDVLDRNLAKRADVALIDFALDHNGLNGVELGIALRSINEYIGIVIYSQFTVRQMVGRVPKEMRSGWSFFEKSATMELADYVSILKITAAGKGNWEDVLERDINQQDYESSIFFTLTPRQRSIMTLTIQGKGAQEIAQNLDLSYSYVRKELSRAYAVLLPNSDSTTDLKTAAVIKYMELMRL
jgi:DNA-binding NarL/FixJ family response regulator